MKKIWNILKPIVLAYILETIAMIIAISIYLNKHNYTYELNKELYTYLIIAITISLIPISIYLFKKNYRKEDKLEFKKIILSIIIGVCTSLFYNMLVIKFDKGNEVLINLGLPLLIIYTGILGPIFEEILFRYVALEKAKENFNELVSIVLVTLVFAILHSGIINIVYATILGTILCIVYRKNRNILYPIILHMSANITSLFLTSFNVYLLLISLVLLFISIVLIIKQK